MTNNEIIFETVRASFTPAQLAELVAATYTAEQIAARRAGVKITVAEGSDETPDAVFHAMLAADTFHTFAEWKRMGYSVKKGQHAALVCNLWKYTDKPGKAARAVKAYFAECDNDATAEADKLRAELAQAQNELSAVRGDLNRATNKIAELEAQQAAPAAEQPEPKTAAELIAARFADLAGVTTTIKGAQTAAPVVWLAGDTERHADAIKAAGAKWSNKKSAYYVRVA